MKELNRRLFYHLDDLREDAGVSINDFCEGVCDRRQYSRYKNGRQEVSLKNMTKFYRKLGFSEIEFYYSYYNSDLSEYPKLNKLYYNLVNRNLKEAKELVKELRDVEFLGERTRRYFRFLLIYSDYIEKKVSVAHSVERLKVLVDYDNCLKKKFFDFIDIASLRLIMIMEMRTNNDTTLLFLYELISKQDYIYVTSESRNILPSFYSTVSRYFGMLDDIDKVLEITSEGIKYSIEINNMHLLDNLFYFKALAHLRRGEKEVAYTYIRKSFEVLDIMGDKDELKRLKSVVDTDIGFDSSELFKNFRFYE